MVVLPAVRISGAAIEPMAASQACNPVLDSCRSWRPVKRFRHWQRRHPGCGDSFPGLLPGTSSASCDDGCSRGWIRRANTQCGRLAPARNPMAATLYVDQPSHVSPLLGASRNLTCALSTADRRVARRGRLGCGNQRGPDHHDDLGRALHADADAAGVVLGRSREPARDAGGAELLAYRRQPQLADSGHVYFGRTTGGASTRVGCGNAADCLPQHARDPSSFLGHAAVVGLGSDSARAAGDGAHRVQPLSRSLA